MILKEWAEANGLTLEEAKAKTGLTHWKQQVVEAVDTVEAIVETAVEVVEDVSDLVNQARALQGPLGFKTLAYLEFVYDNREKIQSEYELVKKHIVKMLCKN